MTMKELKEENARLRNALEKIYRISHNPQAFVDSQCPEFADSSYPYAMGAIQFFSADGLRKTEENEA